MEEDRQFIRLLIERAREDAIKLFDYTLSEFDKLPRHPSSKRRYHSQDTIYRYRRNINVALCNFKVATTFVIRMIRGINAVNSFRMEKVAKLKKIYEDQKRAANKVNCKKVGSNEPVI